MMRLYDARAHIHTVHYIVQQTISIGNFFLFFFFGWTFNAHALARSAISFRA